MHSSTGLHLTLVAYQCGPGMGSVSQIGWEWYSRLCRLGLAAEQPSLASLTLVTSVRNRPTIQAQGACPAGVTIHYIDTEWFAAPLYKFTTRLFGSSEHTIFMFTSLDFLLFDACVVRWLKQRIAAHGGKQLIHLVTPVSALLPTRLASVGVPLVIGPLNSGLPPQTHYPDLMRADFQWLYGIKSLIKIPQWLFGSLRRAQRIYVAMRHVMAYIPSSKHPVVRNVLENGVDLTVFTPQPWPCPVDAGPKPVRLLFVGRLVPVKGVNLLIEAVRRVHEQGIDVRLDIIGDGGMRAPWEQLVQEAKLKDAVTFHGNRSLPEIAAALQQAHALCLPSVRESGGAVILEAAACARPSIVVDFGGPKDIVTEDIGYVVSADGPEPTINDLVRVIVQMARHPEQARQRGLQARSMVESRFAWDAKIQSALADYASLS